MTTSLAPFSGDRPTCAKCGHNAATCTYRDFKTSTPVRLLNMAVYDGLTECLIRTCERCGYRWDEATATNDDAVPFRGRVPLGQQFYVDLVFVGENSPGETHVRVVHEPSGLHQVLSCAGPSSAASAESPLRMFQVLLDQVDAWGRQPLGASCSPAAEVTVPNNQEQQ